MEKIDASAHRTDISAEKPANDEGGSDENQGPENTPNDLPRSKNGIQAQEGIEPEVKIGRKPIRQLIGSQKEESGEKEKGKGLDVFLHAAPLNILSWSISIFPNPR